MKTRRLVSLSLLLALSVALHYFEGFIPIPFVPGYHLGLSNLVNLFALFYFGIPSFVFVSVGRVLLVALLYSGFQISFFMSLSGCLLSIVASIVVKYLLKGSIFSTSSMSALFHSIGQLVAYALFFMTPYIFYYLAFLGPMSIATGLVIAFLDRILIHALPSSFKEEEQKRRRR